MPSETAKPIRVMIFPDRPDCILFYVPSGEQLVVPGVPAPFNKRSTSDKLAEAGIDFRITESVPGRWTESVVLMKKAERAERHQVQKQKEAADAMMMRSGTEIARTRAEAVARKNVVDERIRDTKTWLGRAKSRAYTTKQYEDPERYRRKERELAELQTESLAIQQQLGELKKREKAENIAASNEELNLFRRAAHDILSSEQFDMILDRMSDYLDEEES